MVRWVGGRVVVLSDGRVAAWFREAQVRGLLLVECASAILVSACVRARAVTCLLTVSKGEGTFGTILGTILVISLGAILGTSDSRRITHVAISHVLIVCALRFSIRDDRHLRSHACLDRRFAARSVVFAKGSS